MSLSSQNNSINVAMWKSSLRLRIWLARHLGGPFSRLYSVFDTEGEVPVQIAAYRLATDHYLRTGDSVLDVGFGLGYGLKIMSEKAARLSGIEVDRKAVERAMKELSDPKIMDLRHYDGYSIPFSEQSFDIVTCIDVIEHVPDYVRLIRDLCRVARRAVLISTPNRRDEYTRSNGRPKNPWHIREWSFKEFDAILRKLGMTCEWNFVNGPWEGPFSVSQRISQATIALAPALIMNESNSMPFASDFKTGG